MGKFVSNSITSILITSFLFRDNPLAQGLFLASRQRTLQLRYLYDSNLDDVWPVLYKSHFVCAMATDG